MWMDEGGSNFRNYFETEENMTPNSQQLPDSTRGPVLQGYNWGSIHPKPKGQTPSTRQFNILRGATSTHELAALWRSETLTAETLKITEINCVLGLLQRVCDTADVSELHVVSIFTT
jgi:hypothetical protein